MLCKQVRLLTLCMWFISGLLFADTLEEGIRLHDLTSLELDADMIEDGLEILESVYSRDGDVEALAYWGSMETLKSNLLYKKGDLVTSLAFLESGSKKIDQAVEMAPDNIDVRLLRVINGLEVSESSPVNRSTLVSEDVVYLSNHIKEISDELLISYYYYSGVYHLEYGDIDSGLTNIERVLQEGKTSGFYKEASHLLLKWEE